jgi:hypothetical protein
LTEPRLATGFWVAARIRHIETGGGFAAIQRKGDGDAGAIFIVLRTRDGLVSLAGPAPQAQFSDTGDSRKFEWRLRNGAQADADAILAKEARFDPDFWVIDVDWDQHAFAALFGLIE